MLKQTIKYTDFEGREVTEDFYFNFSMLEMIEQVEIHQVHERMQKLVDSSDAIAAYKLFKQLVLDAHGEKSLDGKKFHKSDSIRADFEASAAISELIISFLSDAEKGIAFVKGVLPQEMLDLAVKEAETRQQAGLVPPQQPAVTAPPQAVTPLRAVEGSDVEQPAIAAQEAERERPGTPLETGVGPMSTSEKRMYSSDELDAIQGVPGTVPVAPSHPETYTDEQVLAMSPQELNSKGLLLRAYQLKSQQ